MREGRKGLEAAGILDLTQHPINPFSKSLPSQCRIVTVHCIFFS